MHLMYTLDKDGKRKYTLKKKTTDGTITKSAHPGKLIFTEKFLNIYALSSISLMTAFYFIRVLYFIPFWNSVKSSLLGSSHKFKVKVQMGQR